MFNQIQYFQHVCHILNIFPQLLVHYQILTFVLGLDIKFVCHVPRRKAKQKNLVSQSCEKDQEYQFFSLVMGFLLWMSQKTENLMNQLQVWLEKECPLVNIWYIFRQDIDHHFSIRRQMFGMVQESIILMIMHQALRDHWRNSTARFIPLKELGPLLRDYQRQITRRHL